MPLSIELEFNLGALSLDCLHRLAGEIIVDLFVLVIISVYLGAETRRVRTRLRLLCLLEAELNQSPRHGDINFLLDVSVEDRDLLGLSVVDHFSSPLRGQRPVYGPIAALRLRGHVVYYCHFNCLSIV